MTTINREILIKVDDTPVGLARAETAASIFNLNVANPRENTLNAVTIVPSAKGIVFSPDEYYIGTMDPDEVFTISFGIQVGGCGKNPSKPGQPELCGQVQERRQLAHVPSLRHHLYSAQG